jgi:lipopolysaccharide biosynthesis protein
MFWARTEAIKPLLIKNFGWEDYPEEPLPYDGTVLHAFERLLPFVTEKMGYRMEMTYVPGITR